MTEGEGSAGVPAPPHFHFRVDVYSVRPRRHAGPLVGASARLRRGEPRGRTAVGRDSPGCQGPHRAHAGNRVWASPTPRSTTAAPRTCGEPRGRPFAGRLFGWSRGRARRGGVAVSIDPEGGAPGARPAVVLDSFGEFLYIAHLITGAWRSWLSRRPVKPEVAGSIPVAPALPTDAKTVSIRAVAQG